ncbi:MAG: hypothetical protein ACE5J4_00810 [Candidatus Aenigmatarchaeota archaeon]
MMIVSDFDQTLRGGNSCIEILPPDKKPEGVRLHNQLILECNSLVQEYDDINKLIEAIDQTHYKYMKQGARLLEGENIAIFSKKCSPLHRNFSKIISEARKNNGIKILTCSDWRIADKFARNYIDCEYEILGSELGSKDRKFDGTIKRFFGAKAKMDSYEEGDVYGDDITNIGLFYKAYIKGFDIYLIKTEIKQNSILNATRKFKIPVKYL